MMAIELMTEWCDLVQIGRDSSLPLRLSSGLRLRVSVQNDREEDCFSILPYDLEGEMCH